MPIAFACPHCDKIYEVSDKFAGKQGRCKQCNGVFLVPEPAPSVAAAVASNPYADLEPMAPPPRRSRVEVEENEPLPRNPRPFGTEPTKRRRPRTDHEGQENYRKSAATLIGFGFLAIFLPLLGVQHRVLALLDPAYQRAIGILAVIGGGAFLAVSFTDQPRRNMRIAMMGFLGLIALVVAGFLMGFFTKVPALPDPGIQIPKPKAPRNEPPPGFPPPGFGAGGSPPGFPAPAPAPQPTTPLNEPAEAILYTLSNAQAAREAGPGMMLREISFQVDYQTTGQPVVGPTLLWIIESARSNGSRRMIGTNSSGGHLSGSITVTDGDTGPFKTYIARETFGPGGKRLVKVSNVADMQWLGDKAANPIPGIANNPGMPPNPGGNPGPGPGPGPGRPRRPFGGLPGMPGPNFPRPPGFPGRP